MIESFERPVPSLRDVLRHAFGHNLANGFSAFLFAATGPGAMILAVGAAAGLPAAHIATWLFAGYALSGVLSIVVCWLYRQPLTFGYSMPAVVIVGPALTQYTMPELVGAYIATGALVLVLALTGLVRRATAALPEPIAMAMVAGVFLPFGLRLVGAFEGTQWIAGAMAGAYLLSSASPALRNRFPPLLSALAAGAVAVAATGSFAPPADLDFRIATPIAFMPVFSAEALIEFVIPLTVTVIGMHNIQGFAILRNAGFRPPEHLGTLLCGGGSVVYGILGCVPTVVTGPANAILNVSGRKDWRFVGGIWFGLFFILFGICAPVAVQIGGALPVALIAGLAGLAMLPVLQSAFVTAFRGAFTFGALVTFLVTVAGVTIFGIGSAFWGLAIGYAVSRIVEREDFRKARAARVAQAAQADRAAAG
ncbi:MAG: benzoate/H(+) symporter BenE family transporter [Rhodospirillaceae bacterium]